MAHAAKQEFTIPSDDDDELLNVPTLERKSVRSLFEKSSHNTEKTVSPNESSSASSTTALSSTKPPDNTRAPATSNILDKANSAKPSSSVSSSNKILVNRRQKGNPVLKFVRNVPWEFDDIVPDYELGRCTCALYLSLKYHNRFPEYIHSRLKDLGKAYDLRILLLQIDTKQQDVSYELNQLARVCILAECTLILAFSYEEAGRYLEVYKAFENKPPTDIMGKFNHDYLSQATECLTTIKSVNKTDVTNLLSRFKTLKNILNSDVDSLSLCPGIGPLKARRLHSAFTLNFVKQPWTPANKRPAEISDVCDGRERVE